MIHRTGHFSSISYDDIYIQIRSLLSQPFRRRGSHPTSSIPTIPSTLYLACQNNDVVRVTSCITNMKRKEIDYQYPPNQETALHVATRNQNKEIIEILLRHGAQRSLRNIDGQQAYQLAKTSEIIDLFKRPQSFRFSFFTSVSKSTTASQEIKCESCSLINDNTFYEWELFDLNASEKALKFRHELKPSTSMSERKLKEKLYSIKKGYADIRLQTIPTVDSARIHDYFKRALLQQDPYYLITAYTICQNFSKLLNTDMARNVIHDLKNGFSKFSCDCLYSTEDGTKLITNILLHHEKFQKLSFQGVVYRGLVVQKNILDHYKVNSHIITTTFLSTSKNPEVARVFCDKGIPKANTYSFFCIYEISNETRTALDISRISEFEAEDEVLILPYSSFLITNIEEGPETTNIYLKEQCLTHIFGINKLQENAMKSAAHLFELVGSSLLFNTNDILLEENEEMRPRSKTLPTLMTYF